MAAQYRSYHSRDRVCGAQKTCTWPSSRRPYMTKLRSSLEESFHDGSQCPRKITKSATTPDVGPVDIGRSPRTWTMKSFHVEHAIVRTSFRWTCGKDVMLQNVARALGDTTQGGEASTPLLS